LFGLVGYLVWLIGWFDWLVWFGWLIGWFVGSLIRWLVS
jgi:hypothetical protein